MRDRRIKKLLSKYFDKSIKNRNKNYKTDLIVKYNTTIFKYHSKEI